MNFMRYSLHLSVGLFCVFLSGCGLPWEKKEATSGSKLIIVDINDKGLYDAVHIKDALHVPFAELEAKAKDWNKVDRYVIYCSDARCTASNTAAEDLKKQGFEDVRHYKGGVAAWYKMWHKEQPQLLVVDEIKLTDSIKSMLETIEMTDELKSAAEELKKEIEAGVVPVVEAKAEVAPIPVVAESGVQPAVAKPIEEASFPLAGK